MEKNLEWVDLDGTPIEGAPRGEEINTVTERIFWRKYRVPFERAFEFSSWLSIKPGLIDDEFLDEVLEDE